MDEPLVKTFSVEEVAAITGKHRITIYRAAERGAIPSKKFGRSRMFTEANLREILEKGWESKRVTA